MAVSTAVFLTARDPFNAPFVADFALTSPKGATRHARIASKASGEAIAEFGGPSNGAFGLPSEDFYMGTTGTWHWTCSVKGRTIAHGSFVVETDPSGRQSVETRPAVF
jgi:hypothetical protein